MKCLWAKTCTRPVKIIYSQSLWNVVDGFPIFYCNPVLFSYRLEEVHWTYVCLRWGLPQSFHDLSISKQGNVTDIGKRSNKATKFLIKAKILQKLDEQSPTTLQKEFYFYTVHENKENESKRSNQNPGTFRSKTLNWCQTTASPARSLTWGDVQINTTLIRKRTIDLLIFSELHVHRTWWTMLQ